MPTYVLECRDCEKQEDVIRPIEDYDKPKECACGGTMTRVFTATKIQPDIEPYEVVGGPRAGEMITSRSEHRAYLRQNNLMEYGDEYKELGIPEEVARPERRSGRVWSIGRK